MSFRLAASISPATEGFFSAVHAITNPLNTRTSITFAIALS